MWSLLIVIGIWTVLRLCADSRIVLRPKKLTLTGLLRRLTTLPKTCQQRGLAWIWLWKILRIYWRLWLICKNFWNIGGHNQCLLTWTEIWCQSWNFWSEVSERYLFAGRSPIKLLWKILWDLPWGIVWHFSFVPGIVIPQRRVFSHPRRLFANGKIRTSYYTGGAAVAIGHGWKLLAGHQSLLTVPTGGCGVESDRTLLEAGIILSDPRSAIATVS